MKILILCDMFPPAFAPRMGYLCKYLKRAGWTPYVVTEQINENMFAFLADGISVSYVNYYHFKNPVLNKLEWIITFFLDFFFHFKDRRMYNAAKRYVEKENIEAVLCSTYRTFPLPAALKIAKEYNLPLIADLRDIVEQYASDEYISKKFHTFPALDRLIVKCFKNHLLKNRNKVIESADCVTTVSTWHVETLSKYNKNTRLIYNGYDPELFYPSHPTTKKFILSYTGRILSLGIRDPRPLFEAIERLHNNNLISPETLRMAWYVDSNSEAILKEESEKYNVCQYMDYHPYIPANEIPQLLHNSSILLQIANKCDDNGPKGIMSTKLFEAMATEKPLLCVRSDESCLEETIRKTKTGASAKNADEAYDFILEKYEQWKKQGYTSVSPDKEAVEKFSRKKQADEFMSIFTELIQKKRNG